MIAWEGGGRFSWISFSSPSPPLDEIIVLPKRVNGYSRPVLKTSSIVRCRSTTRMRFCEDTSGQSDVCRKSILSLFFEYRDCPRRLAGKEASFSQDSPRNGHVHNY